MGHPLSGATAIVGLGITPQGKVYGNTPLGFAVDAVQLALADAGLERGDLDGLLLNPGLAWNDLGMGSFQLQQAMGLRDLRLSATMGLGGATACATIQHAAQAIAAGVCTTVACELDEPRDGLVDRLVGDDESAPVDRHHPARPEIQHRL